MYTILIGLSLFGPDTFTFNREIVYVVVEPEKDFKSSVIISEFRRRPRPHLYDELDYYFDIRLISYNKVNYPYPAYKIGRGGDWTAFPHGTFSASGSFSLAFYSALRYNIYGRQLVQFEHQRDEYYRTLYDAPYFSGYDTEAKEPIPPLRPIEYPKKKLVD